MHTFAERLTQAMTAAQKSRDDLARVLRSSKGTMGLSPSGIGQLLDGTSKSMTAENCARAARYLDVSMYWLATGEGLMRNPGPDARHYVAEPTQRYATAADLLDHLAQLVGSMPAAWRLSVADLLHAWIKAGAANDAEDRRPVLLQLLTTAPHGQSAKRQAHG